MLKKPICSKPCFILFVIPPPPPPPREIEIQFGVWQFFLIFLFLFFSEKKIVHDNMGGKNNFLLSWMHKNSSKIYQ